MSAIVTPSHVRREDGFPCIDSRRVARCSSSTANTAHKQHRMVYKMLLARRKPYLPTYRMLSTRTTQVLKNLALAPNEINAGIYNGSKWIKGSGAVLESKEAATGETLARIATATREETLEVLKHSRQAQEEWRLVPAPRRGEIIRQIRVSLTSWIGLEGKLR